MFGPPLPSSIIGPPHRGLPDIAVAPSALFRGVVDPLPLQIAIIRAGIEGGPRPQLTQVSISPLQRYIALITDPTYLNIRITATET